MKRLAVVLATIGVLATAAPASACLSRGEPGQGSCGLGRDAAQAAVADQTSPGATEVALMRPAESGCTGAPAD
jgi:hypothetical protein